MIWWRKNVGMDLSLKIQYLLEKIAFKLFYYYYFSLLLILASFWYLKPYLAAFFLSSSECCKQTEQPAYWTPSRDHSSSECWAEPKSWWKIYFSFPLWKVYFIVWYNCHSSVSFIFKAIILFIYLCSLLINFLILPRISRQDVQK